MTAQRLFDFLNDVSRKRVSKLEIHNYFEEITHQYNLEKLKLLKTDLENFIDCFLLEENENAPFNKDIDDLSILEPIFEIQNFIIDKIGDYEFEMVEDEKLNNSDYKKADEEIENSSCVEKIVLLKELGVLNFLKDKNKISNNKIALILSSVITEKITTIQPILNPILNQNSSKNNPYNGASKKPLEKVKNKLNNMEIGYQYTGPLKIYI